MALGATAAGVAVAAEGAGVGAAATLGGPFGCGVAHPISKAEASALKSALRTSGILESIMASLLLAAAPNGRDQPNHRRQGMVASRPLPRQPKPGSPNPAAQTRRPLRQSRRRARLRKEPVARRSWMTTDDGGSAFRQRTGWRGAWGSLGLSRIEGRLGRVRVYPAGRRSNHAANQRLPKLEIRFARSSSPSSLLRHAVI